MFIALWSTDIRVTDQKPLTLVRTRDERAELYGAREGEGLHTVIKIKLFYVDK